MPSFQRMFMKTRGMPILYKGITLVMMDTIHVPGGSARYRIVRESTNSEWRQCITLWTEKGTICADSRGAQPREGFGLWEDSAPPELIVAVETRNEELYVKNAWDTGDGVAHSWHNGAAMIIEEIPGGRRYRCNDGHPDEDFDDIIFRIERLPTNTQE